MMKDTFTGQYLSGIYTFYNFKIILLSVIFNNINLSQIIKKNGADERT